jgi:hypothetical protein
MLRIRLRYVDANTNKYHESRIVAGVEISLTESDGGMVTITLTQRDRSVRIVTCKWFQFSGE